MSTMFNFTGSLLPVISKHNENAFFSPYSIDSAFTIVAHGASGTTAEEMWNTLPEERDRYKGLKDSSSVDVANAAWLQEGIEVFPEYKKMLETYRAEIAHADFATNAEGARKRVNKWVYEKTKERIKDILPPNSLDQYTKLVIANAIYFKSSWLEEFNKDLTRDDWFESPEGRAQVKMMHASGRSVGMMEDSIYSAVILPYKDTKMDMLIVLPKSESMRPQVESEFARILAESKDWDRVHYEKLDVLQIPKFKLETDYDLIPSMSQLGMNIVFTDYSKLDKISPQEPNLFISAAFHKAFVEVDRKSVV